MRKSRMFFALLTLCLGVLWGGGELVLAQSNPIQPSTWGGIKAMYGAGEAGTSEVGSGEAETPISADYINELGRQEADKLTKSGRQYETNGGWVLYISVPFYSQNDGCWSGKRLGYARCSDDWIWKYGCHLCCVSMLYAKWGYYEMNPPTLNDWTNGGSPGTHYAFNASGCGDLIRLPEALQYMACRRNRTISVSELWNEIAIGHPVVAKLRNGTGYHFVVIFGYRDGRYYVKDPWQDGAHQDQPLGDVLELRVYGY